MVGVMLCNHESPEQVKDEDQVTDEVTEVAHATDPRRGERPAMIVSHDKKESNEQVLRRATTFTRTRLWKEG